MYVFGGSDCTCDVFLNYDFCRTYRLRHTTTSLHYSTTPLHHYTTPLTTPLHHYTKPQPHDPTTPPPYPPPGHHCPGCVRRWGRGGEWRQQAHPLQRLQAHKVTNISSLFSYATNYHHHRHLQHRSLLTTNNTFPHILYFLILPTITTSTTTTITTTLPPRTYPINISNIKHADHNNQRPQDPIEFTGRQREDADDRLHRAQLRLLGGDRQHAALRGEGINNLHHHHHQLPHLS